MNHIIYQFFNQTVKQMLINRSFRRILPSLELYYPFVRINGISPHPFVWLFEGCMQETFVCSKATVDILEKGEKYVQS